MKFTLRTHSRFMLADWLFWMGVISISHSHRVQACDNIVAELLNSQIYHLPDWQPAALPAPVMTCIGKVYPGDSKGNAVPTGSDLGTVQGCCQGPHYTVFKDGADPCTCNPTLCLSQYTIEAAANAAILLNSPLNASWQLSEGPTPIISNTPQPTGTPGANK